MMEQLRFFIGHSLNDLRVNGRRTIFALLCVAAGVAAIVSLQTLGVMIQDTLTGNLQATNRGDIKGELGFSGFGDAFASDDPLIESGELVAEAPEGLIGQFSGETYYIGEPGLERLQAWLDENYPGSQITPSFSIASPVDIFLGSGRGTVVTATVSGLAASQVTPRIIDPALYPFYDTVTTLDGQPLSAVLREPTDIVIDQKVAEATGAQVGDIVRVTDADADFTVRGIVPTDAEISDPFTSIFAAQFGFYYLPLESIRAFGLEPRADTVYIKLSDPTQVEAARNRLERSFDYLRYTGTDELVEQNQAISEQVNNLVTILGLVGVLLGSIGIINTMQVIVKRRTVEIAVLKTLGLQANQVTTLFLVEALIMGVIGSLLGVLLGWAMVFVIRGVAEGLIAQPLPFRIALAPVLNGIVVGTIVTAIFGFLPTLAAGQVRPGVVLRPTDEIIPRAGCLRTLLVLVFIIAALTLVVGGIVNNWLLAFGVTMGAFIFAGILVGLLNLVIWLIGKLVPTFGIPDLKISLRQMLASRGRGAITLLALVVGVFSLSLVTLLAQSINQTLDYALNVASGGNILITTFSPLSVPRVEAALQETEGVNQYQVVRTYSSEIQGLEEPGNVIVDRQGLSARVEANNPFANINFGPDAPEDFAEQFADSLLESLGQITGRDVNIPLTEDLMAGRIFTPADAGQPVMVVTDTEVITQAGIDLGDRVVLRFGEGSEQAYEVIGILRRGLVNGFSGTGNYIPTDSLPDGVQPENVQLLADVQPEQIPAVRRALSTVPGTFVLETAVLNKLITALLGTFTAFPTIVAFLGLIVGGIVIANSVALATLERRREIAVMKAIGLQRERVLGMLLLENGILGLIGGLIGVGLALVGLLLILASSGGLAFVPYGTALLLMGLCILVALIAAATTAWGAAGEKPLNVLRYE
ncbi:MAG: ABC transporter permease [Anaerolineae bacterium]|nr:ABC transporter permease [Anaerolineae bacterium]